MPPKVEHDHVAFFDRSLAHLVMRVGAVRTGADDREVDLRMSVLAQEAGEIGSDLALAAAGELHLRDLLEARIRGRAGGGQPLELVSVFDRPQHRQRARHRHVRRVGQSLLQAEHVHRPRRVGDRVARSWVEELRGRGVRVTAVRPVGQRQGRRARSGLGIGTLEDRHDHRRPTRGLEHEHRDPLRDRDRLVAREVQEVGPGCDEDARKSGRLRLLGRAIHPP
jgi:hypothetical protein